MLRRRPPLRPALALTAVLVLALIGGLVYWSMAENGPERAAREEQAGVVGPDVGADATRTDAAAAQGATYVPIQDEIIPSAEYLEALRQAIEDEYRAAQARQQARVQDETVAATAIRQWGAGRLLLSLPSIGVTAAVSSIGFEPGTRTPAIPYSAWGVGWYNFTDYPGVGGNAVFSGHVDYYTGEPAVFGRLGSVKVGDLIYVILGDGTPLAYQVGVSYYVTPYTANVAEIFGITASDAITFITCGGAWDAAARDYSHRLIVRAFRVR